MACDGPGSLATPSRREYTAIGSPRLRWARALLPPAALILALVAAVAWRGRLSVSASLERSQEQWIQWPAPFNGEKEKCGLIEDSMDYQGSATVKMTKVATLQNVGSPEMCCAACAGYPECSVWTWGKKRGEKFLTDACFLKGLEDGAEPTKVANPDVVSGFKNPEVQKHGVMPAPASKTQLLDGVTPKQVSGGPATAKCPGKLAISGHGQVSLINAGVNVPGQAGGQVLVQQGDLVVPHMGGRTYFGNTCSEGPYDPTHYAAINFLGKRLRYTTDVSGTGCGCNAALYLTSMQQNSKIGKCQDYYCDAMSVCGVPCGEIDLQEASQYAWFSTLHTFNSAFGADSLGVARGYGGSLGEPPRRDWTASDYGPGGRCVDTTSPFEVAIGFPVDGQGTLEAMEVTLSQQGKPCKLSARNDQYPLKGGRNGLAELTTALQAGMTPIISYWSSADMLWMDGLGADGRGPCVKDAPKACPDSVRFYGFSIEDIAGGGAAAAVGGSSAAAGVGSAPASAGGVAIAG